MFVIQQAQRTKIEKAKANFLKFTGPWVEKGVKSIEEKANDRISKLDAADAHYKEKLEFANLKIRLFQEFLNEKGALYYPVIQAKAFDQMEDYWIHTFLKHPNMKAILDFFGYDSIMGDYEGIPIMKSNTKKVLAAEPWKKELYASFLEDFENAFPYENLYEKPKKSKKSGKVTIPPYNAYRMCRELGIEVCVYCNASYAFTITDKDDAEEICRPDLDHFMPKSHFPIFRLSFENLLPACNMCNSKLKGDKIMVPSRYLHAYQKIQPKVYFGFTDVPGEVLVEADENQDPDTCQKLKKTMEFFKTQAVYRTFQSQVQDLWEKKTIYTPEYLADTMKLINNEKFKIDDRFLDDLFGNVPEEKTMNVTLGTMRHQLVEEILQQWKSEEK